MRLNRKRTTKRFRKTRMRKTKTRRFRRQLGASSTKIIAPYAMKTGGNFYKQAPPLPPPFVGAPWTGNVSSWPGYGTSTINHGNHFSENTYDVDPKMMIQMSGGKKKLRKRKRRTQRKGGASFLQNATNSYRDIVYNIDSAYNAYKGVPPPVNPAPYKDQLK